MDIFEKFLLENSYKFSKGYPDMDDSDDLVLLEELIENTLGEPINLFELKKQSIEILSPEALKIAQDLIDLLNISPDQIQPPSSNIIVIYDDSRSILIDKVEDSGKFGKKRHLRNGNFKIGKTSIIFKPDKTSGEYYELKPQQLGITLGQKIDFEKLKSELERGIKNNKKISEEEKSILLYLVTKEEKPPIDIINSVFSTNKFYNELLKNLGEVLGAILYGEEIKASGVEFPKAGNYPMIDYILHVGEKTIPISAKTSKGEGNTVKLPDLAKIVNNLGGKIDNDRQQIINTIEKNSVNEGAIELIKKFGSDGLKEELDIFLNKYPNFPGNLDYEGHKDRIILERAIINELNSNPDYDFSELFNNYINVLYIKYKLDIPSLDESYILMDKGNFKVSLKTKNSPGHDSDKIGLMVKSV